MKGEKKAKKSLVGEPAALHPKNADQRVKKKHIERAERELPGSEDSFRALAESANDGILIALGGPMRSRR